MKADELSVIGVGVRSDPCPMACGQAPPDFVLRDFVLRVERGELFAVPHDSMASGPDVGDVL